MATPIMECISFDIDDTLCLVQEERERTVGYIPTIYEVLNPHGGHLPLTISLVSRMYCFTCIGILAKASFLSCSNIASC